MDLSSYSGLRAAVTDFMFRNDLSGSAAGFIALAEKSLSRKLNETFALSDAEPTNWLLEEHPDVYLAAAIVWGCAFTQDFQEASTWEAKLRGLMAEVRRQIALSQADTLKVDDALLALGCTRTNLIEG